MSEHKPFYAANSDYSNATFGTLKVVGKIQTQFGYRYQLVCEQCGCQGQTVSQQQLAKTEQGTLKCANSGCSTATTTSVPRSESRGHVEQRLKEGVIMSPRQRMEAAARQAEIDGLEQEGQ
jgi:hypothetical protein